MSTLLDLSPGFHKNVPAPIYHERVPGYASKSALDLVHRSPAHYKAWLDGVEQEPTPALEFGAAFHCALLEPHIYESTYAVMPDFGDCRKPDNKARRDAWKKGREGIKLLDADDAKAIRAMCAAVQAHPLGGRMLADGEPELTLIWQDPETGLRCKSRADYRVKALRMAVDAKSTQDASPEEFRRSIANFSYHAQDAMYRSGFAALGEPIEHFAFLAVEKKPPHAIAIYTLDAGAIARGHARVREDMRTLARCLEKNDWPAYPVEIQSLSLPSWAA